MRPVLLFLGLLWALPTARALPLQAHRPAPSSTLTHDQAIAAADMAVTIFHCITGREYFVVSMSGRSMRPTVGDVSVAVIEKVDLSALRQGDFIVSVDPVTGQLIAHRVFEINRRGAWCIGDNNFNADRYLVTNANLVGRVVAVFYVGASDPH